MEEFVKNFVDALYKGEFGVVISQARTRIKRMVKVGQNEILIKYKDPLNKTYGIMILFNYEVQSYEIKYRGKTYKKLARKIEKYFRKNNLNIGTIGEI